MTDAQKIRHLTGIEERLIAAAVDRVRDKLRRLGALERP